MEYKFLVNYFYNGLPYATEVWAKTWVDAQDHVKQLGCTGEIVGYVPILETEEEHTKVCNHVE